MARKPKVTYWPSRGAYGCWIDGVQHILAKGEDDADRGPVYLSAMERFTKLLGQEEDKTTADYKVSAVFNAYRLSIADRPKRLERFDEIVKGFNDDYGNRPVGKLLPVDVDHWLATKGTWGANTRRLAGALILSAFAYAARKGLIPQSPFVDGAGRVRIDLPAPLVRGEEATMPAPLMDLLEANATGQRGDRDALRQLLRLLRATGARPAEIVRAEAFNFSKGRIVYRWNTVRGYVWKNARKTKRDRHVYLTPELTEYAERCCQRFPTGPIFRSNRGLPWTSDSLSWQWRRLLGRPAVAEYLHDKRIQRESLKPYNYRHTWITRYVQQTRDVWGAAKICGTSVKMIEERYCHFDADVLAETYAEFMKANHQS